MEGQKGDPQALQVRVASGGMGNGHQRARGRRGRLGLAVARRNSKFHADGQQFGIVKHVAVGLEDFARP